VRQLPPAYLSLAQWLLAWEAQGSVSPSPIDAAEAVLGKLHGEMARLIGSDGYRAVLTRALHLAQAEYPFLGNGAVKSEGSTYTALLEGLRASLAGVSQAEVRDSLAVVLGNVLWLLGTFIGADLARRQVRLVWPDAPGLGASPTSEEDK
jgi:hypothetical protein